MTAWLSDRVVAIGLLVGVVLAWFLLWLVPIAVDIQQNHQVLRSGLERLARYEALLENAETIQRFSAHVETQIYPTYKGGTSAMMMAAFQRDVSSAAEASALSVISSRSGVSETTEFDFLDLSLSVELSGDTSQLGRFLEQLNNHTPSIGISRAYVRALDAGSASTPARLSIRLDLTALGEVEAS